MSSGDTRFQVKVSRTLGLEAGRLLERDRMKDHVALIWSVFRGGKRCERCERCSCKDFSTGVKILVKNVIKGGQKMFSPKLYLKNVIKGGVKTAGNQRCL